MFAEADDDRDQRVTVAPGRGNERVAAPARVTRLEADRARIAPDEPIVVDHSVLAAVATGKPVVR